MGELKRNKVKLNYKGFREMVNLPSNMDKKQWGKLFKSSILVYDRTVPQAQQKCISIPGSCLPEFTKILGSVPLVRRLTSGKTFERTAVIAKTANFWGESAKADSLVYLEYEQKSAEIKAICIVANSLKELVVSLKAETLKAIVPKLPNYLQEEIEQLRLNGDKPFIPVVSWSYATGAPSNWN